MKKYTRFLYKILFVLAILTFSVSCEKQVVEVEEGKSVQKSSFLSLDSIQYSIENNTLKFESYEDFYRMRDYLGKMPDLRLPDFEKHIGFYSLRKHLSDNSQSNPVVCEDMLTLLNPDYSIIVGDFKFIYQIEEETVEVINQNSKNLKSAERLFNWSEDVEGVVFFNQSVKSKKSITAANYEDDYSWTASNNTTINATLKYVNIPLFYDFFVKINKTLFRPGVTIYFGVGKNEVLGYPTFFAKHTGGCTQEYGEADSGDGSSYSYHIVKKRLDACYGSAYFISWDYYQIPPIIHEQGAYIEKDRDGITCD